MIAKHDSAVPTATDPSSTTAQVRRGAVMALLFASLGAVFASHIPVCPSAGLFGVPCPGCGMGRATLALLRGDLGAALHLHPLVPLAAPVFIGFALASAWSYVRGPVQPPRSARAERAISAVALACVVGLLVVWLARFFGAFGGPVPVVRWW